MHAKIMIEASAPSATVWIDNPGKRNALTRSMWVDIGEAFRRFGEDDELRCIVLRGAGTEAFASGADIEEFATVRADREQALEYGRHVHEALAAVRECPVPVLAAIDGACVGGGLELASVCDLRICTQRSRFGIPVAALGATLAYAELEGLMALAGRGVALELLLEGRIWSAGEALAKGLVSRVVDATVFDETVHGAVQRICAGAPLSARWHKKFVNRLSRLPELSAADVAEGFACFDTEDYRIGTVAFLAKARPSFVGR